MLHIEKGICREDMDSHVVAIFGENRTLWNWQYVLWFWRPKNPGCAELHGSSPQFVPNEPISFKISRALWPIDLCNLVRIGWGLPEVFPKDWFFGPSKWLQCTKSYMAFSLHNRIVSCDMVSHGAARTEIGLPVDERHLTRYADTCIELIAHVYTPKALSQTDVMAHSETSKRIDTPPTLHVLLHATLQHIKQQCFFFAFPIAKKTAKQKFTRVW